MRGIPIGIDDFKELRDKRGYYVDKTDLISDILDSPLVKVFLYIRPRRFGKSLNISMLDAYLNLEYAGNTWFDGLSISLKRPDDPLKNSFPVINLDLKDLETRDYEGFLNKFRKKIASLYSRYDYLNKSRNLKPLYRTRYEDIVNCRSDDCDLASSILYLSEMLEMHHGIKPVILIDEYDSPLNSNYGKSCHGDVLLFVKGMLSEALKGNDSLAFSVVTGVMQISKESIFSGLNNILVNNIFSTESDEMFGFTSDEVDLLCREYGHPEKYEEARKWYDGYVFGNAEIYNPWSVLNYVRCGFKPDEYWAGTSGNSIINTLLEKADKAVFDELKILGEGGSLSHNIDSSISFVDMTDKDGIYSVMTLSGYLKATPSGRNYLLSIPNMEMYRVFGRMTTARFDNPLVGKMDRFCDSIMDNDTTGISESMSSLLMEVLSSRILGHESSYQAFTAGMLLKLCGRYCMFADGEKGKGFYDILLKSNHPDGRHIIMEFKKTRSNARNDTMKDVSMTALQQIRDREYFHGLKGDVLIYGIAVRGKDVVVSSDSLQM